MSLSKKILLSTTMLSMSAGMLASMEANAVACGAAYAAGCTPTTLATTTVVTTAISVTANIDGVGTSDVLTVSPGAGNSIAFGGFTLGAGTAINTVNFNAGTTTNVGTVGAVTLNIANGATATTGAVTATTVNVASGSTATMAGITATGVLTVGGTLTTSGAISSGSTIISTGGVLNNGAQNITAGAITVTGTGALNVSGGTITPNAAGSLVSSTAGDGVVNASTAVTTFAGGLGTSTNSLGTLNTSGAGGVTLNGSSYINTVNLVGTGTTTLGATLNATNAINVGSGTILALTSHAITGAAPVVLDGIAGTAGGTLTVTTGSLSATNTVDGQVANTGTVTVSGINPTLSNIGANKHVNTVNINANAAVSTIINADTLINVATGEVLTVNTGGAIGGLAPLQLTGTGAVTLAGGTVANSITAAANTNGTVTANAAAVSLPAIGTSTTTIGTLAVSSGVATMTAAAYAGTAVTVATGSTLNVGSYILGGGGTVTLTGTGTLSINGGEVKNAVTAAGAGQGTIITNGVTLFDAGVAIGGTAIGTFNVNSGNTTLGASAAVNTAFTVANGAQLTLLPTTTTSGTAVIQLTGTGQINVAVGSGSLGNAVTGVSGGGVVSATGAGTISFGQALGSSTAVLGTLATASGTTSSIGANSYVTNLTGAGAVTVGAFTLNLTSGGMASSTIDGTAAGTGTLTFAGNASTSAAIGSNAALAAINFNGTNSVVNLGASAKAVAATLASGNTLNVGSNTLTTTTGLMTTTGGTVQFNVNNTTAGGLVAGAGYTHSAATNYVFDVTKMSKAVNVNMISAAGTVTGPALNAIAASQITSNNPLAQATLNTTLSTAGLAVVTITPKTAAQMGITNTNVSNAVPALLAASDDSVRTVLQNAYNTGGQSALNTVIHQMAPVPNAVQGSMHVMSSSHEVTSDRMAALRSESGMSAGENGIYGQKAWIKPFTSSAVQKKKDFDLGYKSKANGVAIGVDAKFTESLTLGAAFTFAKTDVKGKDSGNTKTVVDTMQGTLYGMLEQNQLYIEAMGSGAFNKYKGSTTIANFGSASFKNDGNSYGGKLAVGYKWQSYGFNITPSASVIYNHTSAKAFTTTGAGSINRNVTVKNMNQAGARAAVELAYPMMFAGGQFTPAVKVGGGYDFVADAASVTSSFTGDATGQTFISQGAKPGKGIFNAGANLAYKMDDATTISLEYDFEGRAKFQRSIGALKVRFAF